MAWANMFKRCTKKTDLHFKNYGARGIKVCPAWTGEGGFLRFLADVGECPSSELTLSRIDNERGYEPGNVEWAPQKAQMRNYRGNRLLTACGQTKPLAQWVEELGLNYTTVHERLRSGWSHEDALFKPKRGTK
jgi:hypothetical protein